MTPFAGPEDARGGGGAECEGFGTTACFLSCPRCTSSCLMLARVPIQLTSVEARTVAARARWDGWSGGRRCSSRACLRARVEAAVVFGVLDYEGVLLGVVDAGVEVARLSVRVHGGDVVVLAGKQNEWICGGVVRRAWDASASPGRAYLCNVQLCNYFVYWIHCHAVRVSVRVRVGSLAGVRRGVDHAGAEVARLLVEDIWRGRREIGRNTGRASRWRVGCGRSGRAGGGGGGGGGRAYAPRQRPPLHSAAAAQCRSRQL